jgi:hypothetical protein
LLLHIPSIGRGERPHGAQENRPGDSNVGSALERGLNVLKREIGFRLMRR